MLSRVIAGDTMRAPSTGYLSLSLCLHVTLVFLLLTRIDTLIDWIAKYYAPLLFQPVLYPIDIAGSLEFAGAILVTSFAFKRKINWLSAGMIVCIAFAIGTLIEKLI